MRNQDPAVIFSSIIVVLLSIALHEFAHAKIADSAGDPTPRLQGRVTLNPLAHLDPIGTIMIVITSLTGFGFGWGRPVQVDPRRMHNPRWDHFMSVLGGPVTNLLLAAICAIVLRLTTPHHLIIASLGDPMAAGFLPLLLLDGVIINLALCFFNLIPIGPLDGHWLVGTFMPEHQRLNWYRFNRGPGALIFIFLVLMPAGSPFDLFGRVLQPLVFGAAGYFLGF